MKKTLGKAKKKAWKACSEYIRKKFADENGWVSCVTCGAMRQWNDSIDAGHFIPKSRGNAIYFVEENIHPQCKRCNLMEGGNFENYYPYMLDMYGQEKIDELKELSQTTVNYKITDYEEMEQDFKQRLKEL